MHNLQSNRLIVALLIVSVGLMGYTSFAPPASGPTQPGIVATVDLEAIFAGANVQKAADARLQDTANRLNADGTEKGKALKQIEKDLDELPQASEKYKQLLDKYSLESHKYRAYIEFCKAKIGIERAKAIRETYDQIKQSVARLSSSNGYAIVLADDSVVQIPLGNAEDTTRQISARKIVYASPTVSITQMVISDMNAAFTAAGGVVPPMPAPLPPPNAGGDAADKPSKPNKPANGGKTP